MIRLLPSKYIFVRMVEEKPHKKHLQSLTYEEPGQLEAKQKKYNYYNETKYLLNQQ